MDEGRLTQERNALKISTRGLETSTREMLFPKLVWTHSPGTQDRDEMRERKEERLSLLRRKLIYHYDNWIIKSPLISFVKKNGFWFWRQRNKFVPANTIVFFFCLFQKKEEKKFELSCLNYSHYDGLAYRVQKVRHFDIIAEREIRSKRFKLIHWEKRKKRNKLAVLRFLPGPSPVYVHSRKRSLRAFGIFIDENNWHVLGYDAFRSAFPVGAMCSYWKASIYKCLELSCIPSNGIPSCCITPAYNVVYIIIIFRL